jgi:hypothetical protein
VIDQEIEVGGNLVRTLGLAPPMEFTDLASLSERQIESVKIPLKTLDQAKFYKMTSSSPECPKDYYELDRRSRFRIISTSPSLDTRIQSNSCVQIQHVASEMYLSNDTRSQFRLNAAVNDKAILRA